MKHASPATVTSEAFKEWMGGLVRESEFGSQKRVLPEDFNRSRNALSGIDGRKVRHRSDLVERIAKEKSHLQEFLVNKVQLCQSSLKHSTAVDAVVGVGPDFDLHVQLGLALTSRVGGSPPRSGDVSCVSREP